MIWSTLTVSRSRRLHGRVEWRKKWVKRGREGEEGVRLGESVLRTEEGKKKVGFFFLPQIKRSSLTESSCSMALIIHLSSHCDDS